MSFPRRRGFTLVELLVVVGMLATVAGLIIPAVQLTREAADRTRCRNNLKQVVMACQNAHSTHGFIPSNPDTINARFGTTQDHLQPFME